jgi:hypothetical protein
MGPKTREYYAGKDKQHFNWPSDQLTMWLMAKHRKGVWYDKKG